LLCSAVLVCGTPALAGEEVLYQPAPAWIVPASCRRLRRGRRSCCTTTSGGSRKAGCHLRRPGDPVDNPQTLTQLGTLQATWMPDKGDLIVHRVSILRGDRGDRRARRGARLEVLRRERQLEQRMIDGARTATLAVPGLRVGDVLRVSYSTTLSDQALDKEVQDTVGLPADAVRGRPRPAADVVAGRFRRPLEGQQGRRTCPSPCARWLRTIEVRAAAARARRRARRLRRCATACRRCCRPARSPTGPRSAG
jgi:hypothetical protein